VVWLIAFVALIAMSRSTQAGASPSGGVIVAEIVAFVAGLVMLVMWIGALVKLGTQHAWGWFVAVLVLNLIGLGIIGMVAYAVAGPPDTAGEIVSRPTSIAG
jgi:hypothetical protein